MDLQLSTNKKYFKKCLGLGKWLTGKTLAVHTEEPEFVSQAPLCKSMVSPICNLGVG